MLHRNHWTDDAMNDQAPTVTSKTQALARRYGADAVPAAALYLCRFGGGRDADGLYKALFAYNHADWYVRKVLALAAQYR